MLLVVLVLACSEPPPPPDGPTERDFVATARRCAERPPHDGNGVAGTPLDYDRVVVDTRGARPLVRFEETSPRTIPSGLELRVARDGSRCWPVNDRRR